MEKIHGSAAEDCQKGQDVDEGGEEDIGNAAATGALVFALAFEGPGADEVDSFPAVGAGRYSDITHE